MSLAMPVLTESHHRLDLTGGGTSIDLRGDVDYGGWRFVALAEGSSLGAPEPIYQTIATGLADGDYVRRNRYGNRTITFQVQVWAADALRLAQAEAMLKRVCDAEDVALGWLPPDGFGPETIFRAWTSEPQPLFESGWDLDDLRMVRSYLLTMVVQPHGFSKNPITTVAVAASADVPPVTTEIADGSSATGWTSVSDQNPEPAVTSTSGRLVVSARLTGKTSNPPNYNNTYRTRAIRTFTTAQDFSASPYILADFALAAPVSDFAYGAPKLYPNGSAIAASLSSWEQLGDGWYRGMWYLAESVAPAVSSLKLDVSFLTTTLAQPPNATNVYIDNVEAANQRGATGAPREAVRTLTVEGSARTPGSLAIVGTSGLGQVQLYTAPVLGRGGYRPEMLQWLNTGTATSSANPSNVSGYSTTLNSGQTAFTFNIPASALPPGSYLLLVRSTLGGGGSSEGDSWNSSVRARVNAATVGPQVTLPSVGVGGTGAMRTVAVASGESGLTLPTVDLTDNTKATIRLTLTPNRTDITLDQVWLYWTGEGSSLTRVDCGAGETDLGSANNRLWVDGASPDNGFRSRLLVGTTEDRRDAYYPMSDTTRFGAHQLLPGDNTLHVACTGAGGAEVTFTYTPAWSTYAAL